MEKGTKRILAIVIIIGIALGIGIPAGIILTAGPVYETPGVEGVPYDQMIRIGVLGGMTDIQGEGAWEGSWLAAYEINTGGGIEINGTTYYIGIIAEDTYESQPILDSSRGVDAAKKIIDVDKAQFLLGGFRTEAVKSYLEIIMDREIMFIGTGASTDLFCYNVYGAAYSAYNRYKYWWRIMPINSTSLGLETITYLAYLKGYLSYVLNKTVNKVAILREDLDWTIPMDNALKTNLPYLGFEIVADIAYPITADADDFAGYWSTIDAAGAQITVPVISAQGGILMMQQYDSLKPGCLIVGIDVQSQLDTFWEDTVGDCNFEVIMQPMIRTNKTELTIAFWDAFQAKWEHDPLYTAIGSYDAVRHYAYLFDKTQSFDADILITEWETYTKDNPLEDHSVSARKSAWTKSHDLIEGWPYGVTLWIQWQHGKKVCVPTGWGIGPFGIYPDSITTGTLAFPNWTDWAFN